MRITSEKLFWKGTFFIAVSSIVVLGLFTIFYSHYLSRRFITKTQNYGGFLLEAVENGFFQSMMHEDRQFILRMFEDLSSHNDINMMAIYDHTGKLAFSSGNAVGAPRNILKDLQNLGEETLVLENASVEGEHSLTLARSIPNGPDCQKCHQADGPVLGALGIELSMANIDQFNKANHIIFLVMIGSLVALLMLVNLGFFRHFVISPLKSLNVKIKAVEDGNLDVVFLKENNDEIGELESRFGAMVREVQHHHQQEIIKEKEMALMTRDLKHQMEISAVNKQLEDRIRDLDQAHKKIKRLAVRLEDKNVNLGKMVKRISALNRLGVALSSELEIEKLIRLVVNVAVKGLRAEMGFLMLMDEDTKTLRMAYGMGLGEEYDQTLPIDIGDSISGLVAETASPVLIEDISKEKKFRRVSRYGFMRKSVICTPLKIKEDILGTIELTNKRGEDHFTDDDLEMMNSMSAQAAIALDNAKLYRKIQKSYLDTVKALIQAVEEKDQYTRGHSERVTIFSLKIAEMMGLDKKQLDMIKYAGYLHDIGKIGIDINILQKKGKLSHEEYTLVKNHPIIGERIIAPIDFLKNIRDCIGQHHERYDGFGYPCGISGHDMKLESRILGVADAYDAMITDRPYRKAFSKEWAIAELRRCSGTQFDPEVVEVFIEVLETDKEIHDLEKSLSSVGT